MKRWVNSLLGRSADARPVKVIGLVPGRIGEFAGEAFPRPSGLVTSFHIGSVREMFDHRNTGATRVWGTTILHPA